MKLIIAGSRHLTRDVARHYIDRIYRAYFHRFGIEEIISGGNGSITPEGIPIGVDVAGEEWAEEKGIPVKQFPALWETHGRKAGPIRNKAMAEYAGEEGGLMLIWDGYSRGSRNMLYEARHHGLYIKGVKLTR